MISKIDNFDEFRHEISRLHQIIEEEQEKLRLEYSQLGIALPTRMNFESLDLFSYMKDMLSVHKTLQWRGYNYRLSSTEVSHARLISIAGICEMIKSEYTGKFWDLYERIIGWGQDNTVYEWIFERGFQEAGIDLIRTERREFVQTLILESGIPKNRTADIIVFFEIFWRYLRDRDILKTINELQQGIVSFIHIPYDDRKKLKSLTTSASEYSRAFAMAVTRLMKIFSFIEENPEIVGGKIDHWAEKIFQDTGINPLTVLRNEKQLSNLYERLLGKVTPEKLRKIIAAKPPGTEVIIPDGSKTRTDSYDNIQFGEHVLEGAIFTCVPDIGMDLDFLISRPYKEISMFSDSYLLRSTKELIVTINGLIREDIVRELFYNKNSRGKVFFYKVKPTDFLHIRTADGTFDKKISGSEGFVCYPYLYYLYESQKNQHILSIRTNFIRFFCPTHRNGEVQFKCSHEEHYLFEGVLDNNGRANCAERSIVLRNPSSGYLSFCAIDPDSGDIIDTRGCPSKVIFSLDDVMLFSPYTHHQILTNNSNRPYLFGNHRFILYLKSDKTSDNLKLENLKIADEQISGSYRVLSLQWNDQSYPCCITVETEKKYQWNFKQCLDFNLYINKVRNNTPDYVSFTPLQGSRPSDFDFVLNPFPKSDVADQLFWNIVVNDQDPIRIPLKRFYPSHSEKSLHVPGEMIEEWIKSILSHGDGNNAKIEIALCAADQTFASRTFFIFPRLRIIIPEAVRDGEEFNVGVELGNLGFHELLMRNQLGRSKIKIRLNRTENGVWQLRRSIFSARMEIDSLGTYVDISALPPCRAIRFGNRKENRVESARDILKRELPPYDLLIVSGQHSKPLITVNNCIINTTVNMCDDGVWELPLSTLPGVENFNNIVRVDAGGVIQEFNINFRLAIIKMSADPFVLNDTISGKCSYRGPIDSEIELKVFCVTEKHERIFAANCCLKPEGREILDQDFTIALNDNHIEEKFDHYEVAAILKHEGKEHEYGEVWVVHKEDELCMESNEYAVQKIKELINENRIHSAKRILDLIDLDSKDYKLKELGEIIDRLIVDNSIKRIVSDVKKVLHKEYLFDV